MNLSVLSAFVDVVDKSTIELKMIISKFMLAQSCANLLTIYFMLQYSFLLSINARGTYHLLILILGAEISFLENTLCITLL